MVGDMLAREEAVQFLAGRSITAHVCGISGCSLRTLETWPKLTDQGSKPLIEWPLFELSLFILVIWH